MDFYVPRRDHYGKDILRKPFLQLHQVITNDQNPQNMNDYRLLPFFMNLSI